MSNYFVLIFNSFEQANTKPKTTGIKAVIEDDSKYPKPIIIKDKGLADSLYMHSYIII